ncbi:MAG: patatin-like phospholipase family protein [Nanoarchaeota archaeon]
MKGQYAFKNLVFEGGGVKGIAYVGALHVLEENGILQSIERVAGTSAGAIIATLLAVGFTPLEIRKKLDEVNFNDFKDDSFFIIQNIVRLFRKYGWYKCSVFRKWFDNVLSEKVSKDITFSQLHEKENNGMRKLYIIGTDVNHKAHVILSNETTPNMSIADAVQISMGIPLFFQAFNHKNSLYVDGGVYYNYPINLFDDEKYVKTKKENYYNKETLGFRVDSPEEINNQIKNEPLPSLKVNSLQSYIQTLIGGLIDFANKTHLSDRDWHRTIYIDSLGISATQFELKSEQKEDLIESGRAGALSYFSWFDKSKGASKPLNK